MKLKLELKVRAITYADLARRIDLSEASIKRLFSEKNFSLQRLDEICEAAGVDILQLSVAASRNSDFPEPFGEEIEQELADDSDLLLILYYALQGSSMLEIQKEMKCDHRKVFRLCRRLEELHLLEIHPGNQIRCKVSKSTRWRLDDPLSKKYGKAIRDEFFSSPFLNPNEFQDFLTGPLSKSSFDHFRKKLAALFREFNEVSNIASKAGMPDDEVFWFYSGIRPWAPIGVVKRA